ncbi:sugar kinase [Phenylobacterium deserti]|uniref:Sugar kinase n=1 Tax=Phenylobacterium deserti TaxID=1914756 RepID=A0A328ARU5_9CAUL|nr:sugar kinase [Phenylobacterium deserti]RAK56446.1 sugar kinase [Phenylobacterium deserti]
MGGVIALGECMVELSLTSSRAAAIGYAGDTFNTAVYLSRLGRQVSYATALGAGDPFSAGILQLMADEGIAQDLVVKAEGRVPGLYAIERDEAGERRFFYWRDQAPARQFFELADLNALRRALRDAELVYLSGITLAVIGEGGRATLSELLADARVHGSAVAFDPNYRPRLWSGPDVARDAIEAIAPLCRYLSVSGPDLETLYDEPVHEVAARWATMGPEVVARDEDQTVHLLGAGDPVRMEPEPSVKAVDTTGAGDSFNAGYLAARLQGQEPVEAVREGRRLARIVVQHMGAIVPKNAMP